jgi:hypothetical protein
VKQVLFVSRMCPSGSGGTETPDANLYAALNANRPVRLIKGIDL